MSSLECRTVVRAVAGDTNNLAMGAQLLNDAPGSEDIVTGTHLDGNAGPVMVHYNPTNAKLERIINPNNAQKCRVACELSESNGT